MGLLLFDLLFGLSYWYLHFFFFQLRHLAPPLELRMLLALVSLIHRQVKPGRKAALFSAAGEAVAVIAASVNGELVVCVAS